MMRILTLAAALVATMATGPVMAAAQVGQGACTPEAGDNRVTRWTTQDQNDCVFPNCYVQINSITENSADVTVDVQHAYDFNGKYDVPPTTPKVVNVAVMGNDAAAGTVVWGKRVGEPLTGLFRQPILRRVKRHGTPATPHRTRLGSRLATAASREAANRVDHAL
ncbi:MAG: hypothetical protein OXC65_03485 [Thiotrichales bacterium]|nr:hypothetical protein [Thiotrichales bacterium]